MIEHSLALELSHATEAAAIAAARAAGHGDKKLADKAATQAMREFFNTVDFHGRIVIGEGERDEAPMLYIGEELGTRKSGPAIDIAVDPLENTNATATFGPRAVSVLAAAETGGLYHAPDIYMQKLIAPPQAAGSVSLDAPAQENLAAIAKGLDRAIEDLVIVVLNRPRNKSLIADIRATGARIKLVEDGDLMPGIAACMRGSGVHGLMGIGAAPEGVITAAAIRCLKGEMQARFWLDQDNPKYKDQESRLEAMGGDTKTIHTQSTLAGGKEIIFAATGVTYGDLLQGVSIFTGGAKTHTLVMSTITDKVRFIDTLHVLDKKSVEYRA